MNYTGKCISLFSAASVHRFLFSSNRMKENAGASESVRQALEWWQTEHKNDCVFVGGGNAAVISDNIEQALERTKNWSLNILEDAPRLRLIAAHETINGSLRKAFERAQTKLSINEEKPPFGAEFEAPAVVRTRGSTGLAANRHVAVQREGRDTVDLRWLSEEAYRKQTTAFEAVTRLGSKRYFRDYVDGRRFPTELDDLGHREGASHIAIIYADGDDVGQLWRDLTDNENLDGDAFRQAARELSNSLSEISLGALQASVGELAARSKDLERDKWLVLRESDRGKPFLAVRPLLYYGDDLCVVTAGRVGLEFALRLLRNWEQKSEAKGRNISACAGVLIMPQKFPFARGFRLAKSLAENAKKYRRDEINQHGSDGERHCWIDFQVLLEGSPGDLEDLRATYGTQTLKSKHPYRLTASASGDSYDFERFNILCDIFSKWPRSRAKGLLEAILRGEEVEHYVRLANAAAGVEQPPYEKPEWVAPLEMLDFHKPWERVADVDAGH